MFPHEQSRYFQTYLFIFNLYFVLFNLFRKIKYYLVYFRISSKVLTLFSISQSVEGDISAQSPIQSIFGAKTVFLLPFDIIFNDRGWGYLQSLFGRVEMYLVEFGNANGVVLGYPFKIISTQRNHNSICLKTFSRKSS